MLKLGHALLRFLFCLMLALPCSSARANDALILPKRDFTAVAIHETGPTQVREVIHYAAGKLRIERGNGFSITILDFENQTQYLLMANRTYLILPMDDELFRHYVARDEKLTATRKIGPDRIGDRTATKFAFGDDGALAAAGFYWLTADRIMIRREYDDGVLGQDRHHVEYLTDISFDPQPAELFSIPPGYKRAH